ncbi:MAG: DUF1326 domain-containing protein [Gammaproteobacteria bacterium]|nr:DUF1326 domain-containing protein [Gammaproteobacteria bacterium]MCP5200186.1 DUF1326 domain-containing protein [Gammaproteobacteria bacterium]
MNRREFAAALGVVATAPAVLSSARAFAAAAWALEADVAECCSCAIPCPCNFGRPTDKQCLGNRLVRITRGQVGGADLAGIAFLATFDMGKWVRIELDDSLDAAHSAAFEAVFPLAFEGFHKGTVARERVPLKVTAGAGTLAWSTPTSAVEMKRLAGLDGKPITIANLPSPAFYDYTQYESVVHRHDSAQGRFDFSGTNGFTSRMVVAAA